VRKLTSNPSDFGRVAVLMGEKTAGLASAARRGLRTPGQDGRAGLSSSGEVAPGMALQAARGAAHA
jgi:hypothetical protein